VYNPYVSAVPVIGYVLLRNATERMRATTSWLYSYIGRISLETFIAQFHIWLAMDTRGLLVVVPGSWWLNLALVSVLFIWLSDVLAQVTGVLTDWICGSDKQGVGKRMMFISAALVAFNYLPV
jgi:hypothetical protein